jgi:hypothetical protein
MRASTNSHYFSHTRRTNIEKEVLEIQNERRMKGNKNLSISANNDDLDKTNIVLESPYHACYDTIELFLLYMLFISSIVISRIDINWPVGSI